jgi:predicted NACHT family NTPase
VQDLSIPTFIELKVFAEDAKLKAEFGLLNYINKELCICDVSEQQVEKLLHQGRFLILLDGLDEVKADVGDKVLTEVSNFSRKYFRNQFVITCRIAAQLANQRDTLRFTDVEVADFDEEQIEAFAQKWFVAVARNSREEGLTKASQFIKELQLPENQQIRELAVTPILLNLTCSVFQEKTAFPSKRAKLYEEGLDILLDKWDTSRSSQREEAYQNLSLEDKKDLLSQVAFITFERGDYFFEQDQIQQHIADYLRILPDAQTEPKALRRDSKAVLKSLEAQHGLLIERAREIYSFSHLTFQEYFTAKAIVDSAEPQAFENLVSHISENRWREVFLLVSSMKPNADKLLLLMKEYIETRINSDKLQHFLNWVYQKSLPVQDSLKSAAIRAFYLDFYRPWIQRQDTALAEEIDTNFIYALSSHFLENSHSFLLENKRLELEKIYTCACRLRLDKTLLRIFECAHEFERTLSGILWFYNFEDNEVAGYYFCEENFDTDEIGDLDFLLNDAIEDAAQLDKQLEGELKKLWIQLYELEPSKEDTLENWIKYREWWRTNSQSWIDKLNNLAIEYRDLPLNKEFSKEEIELLAQYRYTHKLLVDCLNSGCSVFPEVQKEIEETLLLPKDEIER